MTVPKTTITKTDGKTGAVRPSAKGVCAIIAPSEKGAANTPGGYARADLALTEFGWGPLTDLGAYILGNSKKPVVLVRGTASTAGAYGAFTPVGAGTATQSAGATAPFDDFDVLLTIVAGGTIGVAGITYTVSLDGGLTTSAVTALGTAASIVIPKSNVTILMGTGTVLAAQTVAFKTTSPRMTTADISTALEALRTSNLKWEGVIVAGHDAVAATISTLDTWLAAREGEGRFRFFAVNSRFRTATGETEAQYTTAMDTAFNASASIRGIVAADGADLISALPGRGISQKRATAWAVMARTMSIDLGRDPAYVADGPAPGGLQIADARGNPKHHDEMLYPGLDDLRLATLRSFDSKNGVFINGAPIISTAGSDYVWIQHARCMNRACEIAFDILTTQLSRGVRKNPKPGPMGEIYIAEDDAQALEAMVNSALPELLGDVSAVKFSLSRTDNIGAAGPITLTGSLELVALAYVKGFAVQAAFARSISVAA